MWEVCRSLLLPLHCFCAGACSNRGDREELIAVKQTANNRLCKSFCFTQAYSSFQVAACSADKKNTTAPILALTSWREKTTWLRYRPYGSRRGAQRVAQIGTNIELACCSGWKRRQHSTALFEVREAHSAKTNRGASVILPDKGNVTSPN